MINVVRERLTEQMDALDSKIKRIEQEKKLEREAIDVTEPRKHAPIGSIHPVRWCRISCSRFHRNGF